MYWQTKWGECLKQLGVYFGGIFGLMGAVRRSVMVLLAEMLGSKVPGLAPSPEKARQKRWGR